MAAPMTNISGGNGYSKLMTIDEYSPRTVVRQSDDVEDVVKMVMRLYDKSKAARKDRESKWDTYWDYYNGKQWPIKRPANRSSPNCNVCRSTVQTILPILTDTSPSFGIVARDPADYEYAELMTDVIAVWWSRRTLNHVVVECLMDAMVTDVGILKVIWDQDADDGLGDVDIIVCDPRRVYVPGNAVDFERNCPWVIHEYYKSRGSMTLKFPKYADDIKKVRGAESVDRDNASDIRVRVMSPVDRDITAPDNWQSGSGRSDNDDVRVWEVWMDDDTVIEEEEVNQDGDKVKVKKKKYPHGRLLTILPDAKVCIQDVANPYRDGCKPFVRIVDTLIPRSFYGEGEVAPIVETQRMVNRTFATIMDWSIMMSNPCWIVDANSGVDADMITNMVGQIIVKQPNSVVQRQDAPPIPPQMFELYHTLTRLLETQSGAMEVSQGRKPTGVTAAQAMETLQEAAQTRVRLKERNLYVGLVQLGRLVVSRMLQYYTEVRVIELTGRDDRQGVWPSYVKFFVEHLTEDNMRFMTQKATYDEGLGQYVEGSWEEGQPTIGNFELDVSTGTSLPFIKEQRSQQAIRLYENKAIDREALFDIIELPKKEEVLQRMSEEEAQQAQAQQQAPQPGGM